MIDFVKFSNGVTVVNTTPHPINFLEADGSIVEVAAPPRELIVNAAVEEVMVDEFRVKSKFIANEQGQDILNSIRLEFIGDGPLLIIGSMIAAQAYPGQVVAMTPAPGYERVAPPEKRMSISKFTTY